MSNIKEDYNPLEKNKKISLAEGLFALIKFCLFLIASNIVYVNLFL